MERHTLNATIATVVLVLFSAGVYLTFHTAAFDLIQPTTIAYQAYRPWHLPVSEVDTSGMPAAQAVPVLMYHGVTDAKDDVNTSRKSFIAQMEALKKAGYQTVTIAQYEQFRKDQFELPAKPFIITFDDGRKDSFYPVDDVLAQLGYTATLFVATGPERDGNPFYLTMAELRQVRDTGRWDIEAHGRYSHQEVRTSADPNAPLSRFLASKQWLTDQNRLETDEEFYARVEGDYLAGAQDLADGLGIETPYVAIPQNDYGELPVTNYPDSGKVQDAILKAHFALAFIEVNDASDVAHFTGNPYNFAYTDPYRIGRIEVQNMKPDQLLQFLADYAPAPQRLSLDDLAAADHVGTVARGDAGFRLVAVETGDAAMFALGQPYWSGYRVETQLQREKTRSVGVLALYQDAKDYVSCGTSDNGFFLRAVQDGVPHDLADPVIEPDLSGAQDLDFAVETSGNRVWCTVNGRRLFQGVPTPFDHGRVGLRVWDDRAPASATVVGFSLR